MDLHEQEALIRWCEEFDEWLNLPDDEDGGDAAQHVASQQSGGASMLLTDQDHDALPHPQVTMPESAVPDVDQPRDHFAQAAQPQHMLPDLANQDPGIYPGAYLDETPPADMRDHLTFDLQPMRPVPDTFGMMLPPGAAAHAEPTFANPMLHPLPAAPHHYQGPFAFSHGSFFLQTPTYSTGLAGQPSSQAPPPAQQNGGPRSLLPADIQRILQVIDETRHDNGRPNRTAIYNILAAEGLGGHFGQRGDLLLRSSLRDYTPEELELPQEDWDCIDFKERYKRTAPRRRTASRRCKQT